MTWQFESLLDVVAVQTSYDRMTSQTKQHFRDQSSLRSVFPRSDLPFCQGQAARDLSGIVPVANTVTVTVIITIAGTITALHLQLKLACQYQAYPNAVLSANT